MTLEPLLWLHCSISGRCVLEYIIGTQSWGAVVTGWSSRGLTLEPLFWLQCSISGKCLLEHIVLSGNEPCGLGGLLDGVLEGADEVGVRELDDLHLVLLLHVPEVLVRLPTHQPRF